MTNPVAEFLAGGRTPPIEALLTSRAEVDASLRSAKLTYSAASLRSAAGQQGCEREIAEARSAVREAEQRLGELDLAVAEARRIADARERATAASSLHARWKKAMRHAEARRAATAEIQKYVDWLGEALNRFDRENAALAASCPRNLLQHYSLHTAMSGRDTIRGQVELHLANAGVLRRKVILAFDTMKSLPDNIDAANAWLAQRREEDIAGSEAALPE